MGAPTRVRPLLFYPRRTASLAHPPLSFSTRPGLTTTTRTSPQQADRENRQEHNGIVTPRGGGPESV